jgi:transposase-like protein
LNGSKSVWQSNLSRYGHNIRQLGTLGCRGAMMGMSIEEIASELGVTANRVLRRLKNGQERLRKGLRFKP